MHSLLVLVVVFGISFLGLAFEIPEIELGQFDLSQFESQFAVSEIPIAYDEVDVLTEEISTGYVVAGVYGTNQCDGEPFYEGIVAFGQCIQTNLGVFKFSYTVTANKMIISSKKFSDPGCTNLTDTRIKVYPTICTKNDQKKGTFVIARHYKQLPVSPTGGYYRL
jgi:hypothetical protein